MRSRSLLRRRTTLWGGALALVVVILAASMLIPDYGDNRAQAEPVGPQALNRIVQKNDNAALNAAAAMRARSAREARIADALQDEQDRANAAARAER
ncbi:MAG TPA: hypothetical protein VMG08_12865 [Allosphingosinicella sp.]|nr:hypothetical protein [Allosphingosinicella sp.]